MDERANEFPRVKKFKIVGLEGIDEVVREVEYHRDSPLLPFCEQPTLKSSNDWYEEWVKFADRKGFILRRPG